MKEKETTEQERTSVGHKILTVIGAVLCILLIPILVINCTLIFRGYTNSDEVPQIGGIVPMIVMTDSMYPEIQSGDLMICHTENAEDVKVGDIIAFFDPAGNGTTVVTHRVAEITEDDNGGLAWITKGDANNTEDQAKVPAKNLVGVFQQRFSNLGNVAMFMQITQGLILCVICPIILLVAYDMIRQRHLPENLCSAVPQKPERIGSFL